MDRFLSFTPHARLLLIVGLIGLLSVSCVRLPEPRPSSTKYYLLGSSLQADTVSSSSTSTDTTGLRLGLRKPRLANYLDATTIVTRQGPNEIHFSDFHRWGEDLGQAINRVVAINLENQPGIQSAEIVPWPKGATFDHILQLRVLRFEGTGPAPPGPNADDDAPIPIGHSQMIVGWTLLGPDGTTVQARGTTRHREENWPVDDYADLAAKLDTSLVVLADDIGTRLRTTRPESSGSQ